MSDYLKVVYLLLLLCLDLLIVLNNFVKSYEIIDKLFDDPQLIQSVFSTHLHVIKVPWGFILGSVNVDLQVLFYFHLSIQVVNCHQQHPMLCCLLQFL